MMIGTHILLAAAALTQSISPSAPSSTPSFQPKASASARATARIQIISGVKFGQDYAAKPAGAQQRPALLTDASGAVRPAELLEFQ